MKFKTSLLLLVCYVMSITAFAQTTAPAPKKLEAKRSILPIKIDGVIDEEAWKGAPAALGYTEFRPTPFRSEDPTTRTEVYMLYNDEGIYLGGYCHEKTKDSISTELSGRDGFGNNDFIGFIFDTYNDKINGFEYFITPLGEQMDAKMAPNPNGNSEDFSWNAVWQSAAKIHEDGWSFEMFIPFSAIRFSKKSVQDWGMNITRRRQKTGQQNAWNPVDPNVNGFLTQEGYWTGLQDIKPPLRLQFSPYFSTYVNHYPGGNGQKTWTSSVNGGMDVKYGISQALTLDMTLIPDFGQVKSDPTVLNLTPFEVKYNENRSFFTEGTELFNKGNLFYSRRVGGSPIHYWDAFGQVGANEKIISNPTETKLMNATKVSGRLQNGLGVGVFNAVTKPTYAIIEDENKSQRKFQTSPLTDYSIIVLDQTMKHNSSVSLVNTNVWRSGGDYDANVTAALFDLNDKTNTWNVGGKVGTSNLFNYGPDHKTQTGFTHNIYFGKTSGRFSFNISQTLANEKYQINDIGYFNFNNYLDHYAYAGYAWTKPGKWYNQMRLNFNASYSRRLKPSVYQNASFNVNMNGQLKNLWWTGFLIGYEPAGNDYYEPHADGRFFRGWKSTFVDGWVETNNAKKYKLYTEFLYVTRSMFNSKKYQVNMMHRYRFNDKFTLSYSIYLEPQQDNTGFATFNGNNIIFGRRDVHTVENTFGIKYNFNKKMGIRTDIRHYWSEVVYKQFYNLEQNGSLTPSNFNGNVNQNYNAFNLDAVYTWQFAPGSFINIVWKNYNLPGPDQSTKLRYFKNLGNTLDQTHDNNLSLKVIYFLDYLQLKGHKGNKEKK
ncbi:MAG: carbohydrate binding family 9 domain-containing protein [Chitinophagaceae bacterium]|nr:carbohydrate binding family 9 domain-containing protein [Chitinophagaceae bacterium]